MTEGRVVLINADRAVSCHRWVALRSDAGAFTFTSAVPEIAYAVEAESAPPRCLRPALLTQTQDLPLSRFGSPILIELVSLPTYLTI